MFDPLRAAIFRHGQGHTDEAFWLIFLFIHFGKHNRGGWRYVREVYGRLGDGNRWDWLSVSDNPKAFRKWLHKHKNEIRRPGIPGGFGNHRKHEILDAHSAAGTGAAIESYIKWVGKQGTHQEMINRGCAEADGDAEKGFDNLYRSMREVTRFGRTARFEYLAMIGKLGWANIKPGSTYLTGSTGPLSGARLLFGGSKRAKISTAELERRIIDLDTDLGIGMQALEDALCNWQKCPTKFKPFRG